MAYKSLKSRTLGFAGDTPRALPSYSIMQRGGGNNDRLSISWQEVISLARDAGSLSDPHAAIISASGDDAPPARGFEGYRFAQRETTLMSQQAYDIVVVGAGAAGCVVASYLAEHTDVSVALIEAGDTDRDPFIHIPAGFAKILAHDRHVWKYETVPQHGTKRAYRSGKVLGGGSSINAMAYVRGQIRDYTAWQDAVGETGNWSYNDLLPVFMAQENNDTFHDEFHGINGGLAVQQPKGINELNQYCLKAFQEYGIPFNPDYNGKSQIGVSPVQSTVGNQRRCSAVDAYLRQHLASGSAPRCSRRRTAAPARSSVTSSLRIS
jgi:choline dehydrogenase-like flavoprotein